MTDHTERNTSGGTRFPVFRKLLVIIVMAVFPVLVFQGTVRHVESLENERLELQTLAEHRRLLTALNVYDDETKCLKLVLESYFKLLRTLSPARQVALVERFHRLYPGMADLFFFDEKKHLVQEISSRSRSRKATEVAFSVIVDRSMRKPIPDWQKGLLEGFLDVDTLSLLKMANPSLSDLGPRDRERFFFFRCDEVARPGGLIGYAAFFHPAMMPDEFFMKRMINRVNRMRPDMTIGLVESMPAVAPEVGPGWRPRPDVASGTRRAPGIRLYPSALNDAGKLPVAFEMAATQLDTHFVEDGRLVSFASRKQAGWLLAASPCRCFIPEYVYYIINALSVLWLLFVLFRVPAGGQGWSAPIPTKLLGVFLFGVGIPSLVMLVIGFYALKDHTSVLQQKLEVEVQEKIKQFDTKLLLEIRATERRLKSVVADASDEEDDGRRQEIYKRLLDERAFDMIMVVDRKGREIFNFPKFIAAMERDPGKKKLGQFLLVVAREFIKRLNRSVIIDAGTLVMEAAGGMLNTIMGGSQRSGIDQMIRDRGIMYPMSLGGDSSFLFIDGVTNRTGETIEIVAGVTPSSNLEYRFIRRNIHGLLRQRDLAWRVHAFGDYLAVKDPEDYQPRVLTDERDGEIASRLARETMKGASIVKKMMTVRGRRELWFAVRGETFQVFTFVAAVPLEPLSRSEKASWLLLLSLAGFIVIAAGVLGTFLSEQFLHPIRDLNQGILAIQSRDFKHRIPEHAPDELGRMASLMNQVMEGMKDLEMAKTVQESLFPQEALNVGTYRIFGQSRAMSDIGGDYFDYFPASPNEIAGIVGDVSGHGVAAALIMGMAKCAFTMPSKQRPTLLENLDLFNTFMLATVKKKKMMTMFHFLLNTDTHIFELANAGHNYPAYFTAATGEVRMLETPSCFPLGVSKKFRVESRKMAMSPGDVILLYTDGLVEASRHDQTQVGYELMQEWFLETARATPEEMVEHIFRRLSEASDMSRPTDDISIICLKRDA